MGRNAKVFPTGKVWAALILVLSMPLSIAGQQISGVVIDAVSLEPVPFVNIIYDQNPSDGTISDIDGVFVISGNNEVESITLSHISYRDTAVFLDGLKISGDKYVVYLQPRSITLAETVVYAGENPAIRIIEKAIQNKKVNDPEQRSHYSYHAYHKSVFDIGAPDSTAMADSIRLMKEGPLQGGHLMIIESETKHYYRRPGVRNEELISTRVSGLQRPGFGSIPTMLQPFGFYQDEIQVIDSKFGNPVSKAGLHEYVFSLRDTILSQADTVYVISFRPKNEQSVKALRGVVHIESRDFAIVRVEASPARYELVDFEILQEYDLLPAAVWFPSVMRVELRYKLSTGTDDEAILSATFRSHIDSVDTDQKLDWKDFSPEPVRVVGRPWDRDSAYWSRLRPLELTREEEVTYRVIDSLGAEIKIDERLTLLNKLFSLKVPVGFVDFDISRLIEFNYEEKIMPGVFIETNEKLSDRFIAKAGIQYSFAGNYFKYGGGLAYKFGQWRKNMISLQYYDGTSPPGSTVWSTPFSEQNYIRNFFVRNLDATRSWIFDYTMNAYRTQLKMRLVRSDVEPLYAYSYSENDIQDLSDHTYTGAEISFRMRFSGRLTRSIPLFSTDSEGQPELIVKYQRGFENIGGGEIAFNKFEVTLARSFSLGRFGKMSVEGSGGFVDRSVPYRYLFFMNGFHEYQFGLYVNGGFQTSRPFVFAADRYAEFAMEYKAPFALYRSKFSSPAPVLRQRLYWGDMFYDPEAHALVEFGVPSEGYFETGIHLEKLLRFKYFRSLFVNLGLGVYYAYGPSTSVENNDNLVFKISASMSTR